MVEDDKELSKAAGTALMEAGYQVDFAFDGEEGAQYMQEGIYDVMLLDRMLPFKDGLHLLQEFRRQGKTTPVILLTARDGIHDRIDGLDAGADDYLVKPYDIEELLARIRAILRRPRKLVPHERIIFEDLELFEEEGMLACHMERRSLSKKETQLLGFFMRNANQILTRKQILYRVWGMDAEIEDGNIDNYIYFLRRRLKVLPTNVRIVTIHGIGYRLEREKDACTTKKTTNSNL